MPANHARLRGRGAGQWFPKLWDLALEPTGERLIPEAYAGELVFAEHLARYHLAARIADGRRVLDAASGEGYGAAILAAAGAARVSGVDIDAEVVEHARRRYGLDFRVGDLADLPFDRGEFDLIISFESIEHVAEPERALDEFARILGPHGVLLISTPNPNEYLEDNPFHLRELAPQDFLAVLHARFASVRPLYQQNYLASAVLDAHELQLADPDHELELVARKTVGVDPGRELYTLALCGPSPLPALEANVAVLAGVYEAHQLADRTRAAERGQREWEARATEAADTQRQWQARATEAERQNDELRASLDEHRASLDEHRATLDRLRGTLEDVYRSRSWRMTRPLRTSKRMLRPR
jgi:O-antigen biosynthesis protein